MQKLLLKKKEHTETNNLLAEFDGLPSLKEKRAYKNKQFYWSNLMGAPTFFNWKVILV